jgi:hypothetical protein
MNESKPKFYVFLDSYAALKVEVFFYFWIKSISNKFFDAAGVCKALRHNHLKLDVSFFTKIFERILHSFSLLYSSFWKTNLLTLFDDFYVNHLKFLIEKLIIIIGRFRQLYWIDVNWRNEYQKVPAPAKTKFSQS